MTWTVPSLGAGAVERIDTFVLVSPGEAGPVELAVLQEQFAGKLIVYGGHDPVARRSAEDLRARSAGWASAVAMATDEQGAALLKGDWAQQVGERVRFFVDEQRYLAAQTLRRY